MDVGAKKGEQGLYFTTLSEPTQWMLRYASQFDFINKDYFGDQIRYMDLGNMMREMDANQLLAAIALANKLARMAWAMMARGERYEEPAALAA